MNADNITEFINFVNYVIKTTLSDLETDLDMFQLVLT